LTLGATVAASVGAALGFALGATVWPALGSTVGATLGAAAPPLLSVQLARSPRFAGRWVTPSRAAAIRSMVTARWLARVVSTACCAVAAS
jgi:hypothetical protein